VTAAQTLYVHTSSQHARLSGVLHRRSDGLKCAAWWPPRPVAQCRQFQLDAKDASVSECTWTISALEALHNVLYKFKTYLLTYNETHDLHILRFSLKQVFWTWYLCAVNHQYEHDAVHLCSFPWKLTGHHRLILIHQVNAAPQPIYAGCVSVFIFWNLES